MAKNLIIFDAIEIPFRKQKNGSGKFIDAVHVKSFWNKPAAKAIAAKQGCYVFALRAAKGFCPWYVGKATRSFAQEALHTHQLNHYNAVLFDGRKGTPVLYFVAPSDNLKKVPEDVCDEIETYLIQSSLAENPEIRNQQKTKIPDWTIKGVIRQGQGKPTKAEQAFKKTMGIGGD
jgi:hypothetical protein